MGFRSHVREDFEQYLTMYILTLLSFPPFSRMESSDIYIPPRAVGPVQFISPIAKGSYLSSLSPLFGLFVFGPPSFTSTPPPFCPPSPSPTLPSTPSPIALAPIALSFPLHPVPSPSPSPSRPFPFPFPHPFLPHLPHLPFNPTDRPDPTVHERGV